MLKVPSRSATPRRRARRHEPEGQADETVSKDQNGQLCLVEIKSMRTEMKEFFDQVNHWTKTQQTAMEDLKRDICKVSAEAARSQSDALRTAVEDMKREICTVSTEATQSQSDAMRSADLVAGKALGEPRSADFVAGGVLCEPQSADVGAGAHTLIHSHSHSHSHTHTHSLSAFSHMVVTVRGRQGPLISA